MAEDKAVSHQQVKQVAERALDIERYILRRAWGLGYAVGAVEILLITLLPLLFEAGGLSSSYGLITRIIVNTAISLSGLAVASRIFKKAYAAMLVRREIADSVWGKLLRPWRAAIVWLAYYVPIIIAIIFLRQHAVEVLFGLLVTSAFPFFFALKVSFPERMPREGIAVLVTFTACTLGNLTLFLLKAHYAPYLAVWVVLSAVLLFAALHAYRQKPPNQPEDHTDW